jgi:6-pyruvoyltetrahydropterin/6-carboxytetrahydropterin synthase
MAKATLSKTFRFEAAHHLPNHAGKCREPHGHSYKLTVFIEGKVNLNAGEPDEGMVMDFDVIKRVWEMHLKPILDHKDLNIQFMFVTTAENIAAWILVAFYDHGIPVKALELWETETCCARVVHSDVWGDESMYRAMTMVRPEVGV